MGNTGQSLSGANAVMEGEPIFFTEPKSKFTFYLTQDGSISSKIINFSGTVNGVNWSAFTGTTVIPADGLFSVIDEHVFVGIRVDLVLYEGTGSINAWVAAS